VALQLDRAPVASRTVSESSYECRLLGHAWEPFNPIDVRGGMFANMLHLRCVRCFTERHDGIDSLGGLGNRRYIHPEGYKIPKDEKPSTPDLRLWIVRVEKQAARRRKSARAS